MTRAPAPYRLLTWNLNGRRQCVSGQGAAIATRQPDFVCLQEVTTNTAPRFRALLAEGGLPHIVDSFADSPTWEARGPRRYGLLIASRHPTQFVPLVTAVVWPERILTVSIASPSGALLLTTVHIPPGSSNGWKKVEMLEGLAGVMAEHPHDAHIACGDLNTPQLELPSGEVVTAQRRDINGLRLRKRIRKGAGERWDAGERTVLTGTALRDAFRSTHGYGVDECSWVLRRKDREVTRRFDHACCSGQVQVAHLRLPAPAA